MRIVNEKKVEVVPMIKIFAFHFILMMFFGCVLETTSYAQGGGVVGGGGIIVFPDGKKIPHELYEGEELGVLTQLGSMLCLTYNNLKAMSIEQLNHRLDQLLVQNEKERAAYQKFSIEFMSFFLYNNNILGKQSNWLTEDLQKEQQKLCEGCLIVNAFRYVDGRGLEVIQENIKGLKYYSNSLELLHRHEILYRINRYYRPDEGNSKRIRSILELALSDQITSIDGIVNTESPEWHELQIRLTDFWSALP